MPIQPIVSPADEALLDEMAELTRSRPADVIRSALAVYRWFLLQSKDGGLVLARRPSGEEVKLETADLTALGGIGDCLSPQELRSLAEELSVSKNSVEAAKTREELTRGFYGR